MVVVMVPCRVVVGRVPLEVAQCGSGHGVLRWHGVVVVMLPLRWHSCGGGHGAWRWHNVVVARVH